MVGDQGRRRHTAEPGWVSQHRFYTDHYDAALLFDLCIIVFLHRPVIANETIEIVFHSVPMSGKLSYLLSVLQHRADKGQPSTLAAML